MEELSSFSSVLISSDSEVFRRLDTLTTDGFKGAERNSSNVTVSTFGVLSASKLVSRGVKAKLYGLKSELLGLITVSGVESVVCLAG